VEAEHEELPSVAILGKQVALTSQFCLVMGNPSLMRKVLLFVCAASQPLIS
jgi:hypothetical protein